MTVLTNRKSGSGVVFGCEKFNSKKNSNRIWVKHRQTVGRYYIPSKNETILHEMNKGSSGYTNTSLNYHTESSWRFISETFVNPWKEFLTNHLVPKSMTRQKIEEVCQKDAKIRQGKLLSKTADNKSVSNVNLTSYNCIWQFLRMVLRYKEPSCYGKETKNPNAIYYPLPTNVDRENQSLTSFKFLVVGNRPPGQNAHIASCIQCQTASNSKIIEPLTMTTMPSKPWQVTHGDFCGRFPSGQWGLSLVLIEEHFQFRKMELCLPQICSHIIWH